MNNSQETQIATKGTLALNIYELPSFKEARERQTQLIVENPYTEISDNKTYEEAKKRRTTLRQGRFELQNGLKAIKDTLNNFKSTAENITEELIGITRPAEEKQQNEVTRYEEEKEEEKKRKEEEERQRKDAIKKAVSDFRNQSNQSIAGATFNTIEGIQKDISEKVLKCAEFQDDFEAVKSDLIRMVEQKHFQLQEAENIRIAQIEITHERARSVELKKYDFIYPGEDLGKISETDFLEIRETQRKLFHEVQAKIVAQKAEQEQIEEKNKAEREKLEADRKAIEAEKNRIAKEEADRKYKIRIDSLLSVGLERNCICYDHKDYDCVAIDLSQIQEMTDEEFVSAVEIIKTRISEQDKEKKEAIERKAREKAEREAVETSRQEALKPDKQKMNETLTALTLSEPELSSDEMKKEWDIIRKSFQHFIIEQTTIIQNL